MIQRLRNIHLVPTPYEPFAHLERITPLLRRELHISASDISKREMASYDLRSVRPLLLFHLLIVGGLLCSTGVPWQTILIIALPSLVISIGADVAACVHTISRWHARDKGETWDVLRLAMRDDVEFLSTYETIGIIRSWSAYQFDMSMRVVPAVAAIGLGTVIIVSILILSFFNLQMYDHPLEIVEPIVLGSFLIRMAILYTRDPLWRFRATIRWSLWCAITFRETATAITAAIAGSLSVRLLHLSSLAAVYVLSNETLDGKTIFDAQYDNQLRVRSFILFSVLVIALLPITRWCYARLYAWLERQTLLALRRGT